MTVLPHHYTKMRGENNSSLLALNSHEKPSNVAIIREELVMLTNNPSIAVVLNQLLYWTQRISDFDLLIAEENSSENKRAHGWFYKSAQELIEETMIQVSKVTMRRYLSFLAEQGWLLERGNPKYKWDKTTQYRLNLSQLQSDLQTLGYSLPGFSEDQFLLQASKCSFEGTKLKKPKKSRESKIEASKLQKSTLEGERNRPSKGKKCSFIYLTETTTKTTNKDHTPRVCKKSSIQLKEEKSSSMVELWQKHIGQDEVQLTKKRKSQLNSLLNLHFENDLSKWEDFCKRVKASPFLMGEGPNKWHVTFHWILLKDNILKVLEGNYDSPDIIQQKKEIKAEDIRREKTKDVLESIQDPFWKDWCSQLSEFPQGYLPVNKPLTWWQLERIKNAQFLDFDERLVFIGSSDPNVLKEIEDNRFQVASVVSRTFPTLRSVRTELIKAEKEMPTNLIPSSSLNPRLAHSNTQQRRS